MKSLKQTKIFESIRDSLLNFFSGEFLLFLFFLFLSASYWLIMVLNDPIEREIIVPIRLTDIPNNVVLSTDSVDTIRINITDKGYTVAGYYPNDKLHSVDISFKQYKKNDESVVVTNGELHKILTRQLQSSTRILSIKPDKLTFYYNYGHNKKVPVRLNGEITAATSYFLGKTSFSPDSVTVYGPDRILEQLTEVKTVHTVVTGVAKKKDVKVRINVPTQAKVVPNEVTLHLSADVLTESTLTVPITTINVPQGKRLHTFPAKIKVHFVVGASEYRKIKPEMFVVEADYNSLASDSKKCQLTLRAAPSNVIRPNLDINEVDYLIEK